MALTPVVICINRSGEPVGRRVANLLGAALHGRAGRTDSPDLSFDNALNHIRELFAAGVPIIGVCAAGILIRAVAPLLSDKRREPPVLSVSDDGTVVIPLLGGHRGANRLAREVAHHLDARAAITTAGDLGIGVALDVPPEGYALANPEDAKAAMAAILGGSGVQMEGEQLFDLSPRPGPAPVTLVVGAKPERTGRDRLVYHPRAHVLGVGSARGAKPEALWTLAQQVLAEAGIAEGAVAAVGTIDLKADEPAVIALADRLGVPLRLFTAAELEEQVGRLANPSEIVFAEVGCHGVAEGAALALGGPEAQLTVEKRKSAEVTCALARAAAPLTGGLAGRARGLLALVGIGPGKPDWRTPEASRLVTGAEDLVGYGLYLDLLGPLAAGKARHDFPLGGEEARCRFALERAAEGRRVVLVCSGDAGIYAMGALVHELLDRGDLSDAAMRVEVVTAPGVSALQAAAARAGAPLGHDFCTISLSDLLTPRVDIQRRLRAAAAGDFVVALYNPVSKARRTLLAEARDILLEHRPADCPVVLATSLGRSEESVRFRRLDALEVDDVDMLTVVLVGSSQSRLVERGDGPVVYTPRGYAAKRSAAE